MRSAVGSVIRVAVTVLVGPAAWAADVGGLICTNTTWNLAGSPYVVTCSVLVACNATPSLRGAA